jgi:hypothetical protein
MPQAHRTHPGAIYVRRMQQDPRQHRSQKEKKSRGKAAGEMDPDVRSMSSRPRVRSYVYVYTRARDGAHDGAGIRGVHVSVPGSVHAYVYVHARQRAKYYNVCMNCNLRAARVFNFPTAAAVRARARFGIPAQCIIT